MTRSSAVESFLNDIKKDHEKKKKKKQKNKHHDKKPKMDDGKKRKRAEEDEQQKEERDERSDEEEESSNTSLSITKRNINKINNNNNNNNNKVTFSHKYILAPMVGASELAFRLLCRKYGAQLAYTPMMSAHEFAYNEQYRRDNDFFELTAYSSNNNNHEQEQHTLLDRPLVCHFSANTPQDFAAAAKAAQPYCDAIDLNLGCPQRTAFIGHYGSYLLDAKDRQLICDMIRAAASQVDIPIFCKIRLLPTLEETIQLCRQLAESGASLIAIHARQRASWERKGAGARDGPALLDQVLAIKQAMLTANNDNDNNRTRHTLIVANGNTITFDDVENNLTLTRADGLMSAEGILDNPALFLPRLGTRQEADKVITIPVVHFGHAATTSNASSIAAPPPDTKSKCLVANGNSNTNHNNDNDGTPHQQQELDRKREKRARKLNKKLREIARIEKRANKNGNTNKVSALLDEEERKKLQGKESIQQELRMLMSSSTVMATSTAASSSSLSANHSTFTNTDQLTMTTTTTTLGALYQSSDDKFQLAMEYLDLAEAYPAKMRTVIFHIRRMLKEGLTNYQLLEECLAATSIDAIRGMVQKMQHYRDNPDSFVFDQTKALQEKEALERKIREEGKRKEYEARMIRKAKREGKTGKDLFYYLQIGSTVPSRETVQRLRSPSMPRPEALRIWQEKDHAQHCVAFHLDHPNGCARGRTCAFLHVDISSESSCQNSFVEKDEVAG